MARKGGGKESAQTRAPAAKKASPRKAAVKRNLAAAAYNVQSTAERARELSAALIRAGDLLAQGAAFLEAMAGRAESQPPRQRTRRRR